MHVWGAGLILRMTFFTGYFMDLYRDGSLLAVFEIKVLFCAPAGCKDPKNGAPGHLSVCYSLYKPI